MARAVPCHLLIITRSTIRLYARALINLTTFVICYQNCSTSRMWRLNSVMFIGEAQCNREFCGFWRMDKYRIVSCACIVTTQPAFATVDGVDSACRNVNKNENAIEKLAANNLFGMVQGLRCLFVKEFNHSKRSYTVLISLPDIH